MYDINKSNAREKQKLMNKTEKELKKQVVEKECEGWSTFKTAIHAVQQGIAYLILDNGYDYMLAMQDALDQKKF